MVPLSIGNLYSKEVVCDVIEMDVYHILLGKPWQYDKDVTYKGKANTYSFGWHGKEVVLLPNSTKATKQKVPNNPQTLLTILGPELHQELKKSTCLLALLVKEITKGELDQPLLVYITQLLEEFLDLTPEELPSKLPPLQQFNIVLIYSLVLPYQTYHTIE